MIGVSLLLAVPAVVVFASAALAARVSRWLSRVDTLVEVATALGPHPFYTIVVGIEIVLSRGVVWTAWRWPTAPRVAA